MKLYLKDTIFAFHVWNNNSVRENIWYEIPLTDYFSDYMNEFYKEACDDGISNYLGVSLCINVDANERELSAFNKYFQHSIQHPITNNNLLTVDKLSHEIDNIRMSAYIDITEEEILYLKLKYPEIFKG